jgi:murein DD-endopeptidase MepM/ murein hydrolase activator NlpD
MIAITVQSGDTLSGIAAANGDSLAAVENANPQIGNPNLIYVGQTVYIPGAGSSSPAPAPYSPPAPSGNSSPSYVPPAPAPAPAAASSDTGSSDGSSSGFHIPGMSDSMASCIAYRESTDDTNPAADGNAFGIIPASGYNVAGDSLAQQEQVAGQIYATSGGQAWAADGCAGT